MTTETAHYLTVGAVIFLTGALLTAFFVLVLRSRTGVPPLLRNPHTNAPPPLQHAAVPVTVNIEMPQPAAIPLAYPTAQQHLVAVPAGDLAALVAAVQASHQLTATPATGQPGHDGDAEPLLLERGAS